MPRQRGDARCPGQLGTAARGVAVVHPSISDAELKQMDDAGVRGIRFTQFDPNTATTTMDMIEPLAHRVQALGWHVQIHLRADQIAAAEDMLTRLPGTVVFDHLGRLTPPEGLEHPAFRIIRRMLDGGRTWMKLSGAYFFGGPPDYAEAGRSRGRISPRRRSGWCGAATGRIRPKRKSPTTPCYSICWAIGRRTTHHGGGDFSENPAKLYGFP